MFRADINALRAIAVASVLLFHFDVPGFEGGFVGVDVFFVISGYLITGIVFGSIDKGGFSLSGFFERRLRRIAPALLFMLFACLVSAWFWLLPTDYVALAQRTTYAALFASNIKFWMEAGYFAWSSRENPLLHTWTLGLEAQFYLLLPLLALALARLKAGPRQAVFALSALALLVYCGLHTRVDPTFSFFQLPTRAWEFLLGGWAALANLSVRRAWQGAALKIAGLALVACAVNRFDEGMAFPGFFALLPVAGAVLFVLTPPGSTTRRLAAWAPLQWLGERSYSIYLWHWPVHVFAYYRLQREFSPAEAVALIALTLLLAELSYSLVEEPVRRRAVLATRPRLSGAAAAAVLLLVAAAQLIEARGGLGGERLPPSVHRYDQGRLDRNPEREKCHFSPRNNAYGADTICRYPSAGAASATALWGDSFADAVQTAVMAAARAERRDLSVFSYSACPPILGAKRDWPGDRCLEFNRFALDRIRNDPRIDSVILVGNWEWYTEKNLGLLLWPRPEQGLPVLREAFAGTVCELVRAGKRVTLLGPIPRVGRDTPSALAKAALYDQDAGALGRALSEHRGRTREARRLVDEAAARCGARVVDPAARLCAAGRCRVELDGRSLYYDGDHLSGHGAGLLIPDFRRAMR